MRFSVVQVEFLEALKALNFLGGSQGALLLQVREGGLYLSRQEAMSGSGMEVGPIQGLVWKKEEGLALVDFSRVYKYAASLDADMELRLETGTGYLSIKGPDSSTRVPLQDLAELSRMDLEAPAGAGVTVPQDVLAHLVRVGASCVSSDLSRPVFMGAYMVRQADALVMVSTDGHRLAEARAPYPGRPEEQDGLQRGVTLPVSVWSAAAGLPGAGEGVRLVYETAGGPVFFVTSGAVLKSQPIAEDFPDFTRVFPSGLPAGVAVFGTREIRRILRSVTVFSDKSEAMRVHLDAKKGRLSVKCYSQAGEATRDMDAGGAPYTLQPPDLKDFDLAINGGFLEKAVATMTADWAVLEFYGPDSPVLLSPLPQGAIDGGERFIIMPITL